MPHYICRTCGTQFGHSEKPPSECPICEDERQYVGPRGQEWTTLSALQVDHHTVIKSLEAELTGIGMHPDFAIGQRASSRRSKVVGPEIGRSLYQSHLGGARPSLIRSKRLAAFAPCRPNSL